MYMATITDILFTYNRVKLCVDNIIGAGVYGYKLWRQVEIIYKYYHIYIFTIICKFLHLKSFLYLDI